MKLVIKNIPKKLPKSGLSGSPPPRKLMVTLSSPKIIGWRLLDAIHDNGKLKLELSVELRK